MGRYLERAEHLCRLLRLQTEALVDRPPREIYFGWNRIYGSLNRYPPGRTLEIGDDYFTLADSYTLADDLTFERSNPDSVWSCFALGRENARQMRHCISADMWTRLNLAYLRIQKLEIQDIWGSPETFYQETVAEIATFSGVAAATMYRDQGWSFLQLGPLRRAVAALCVAAADAADRRLCERGGVGGGLDEPSARVFTLSRRTIAATASRCGQREVLELLATDPMLPDSLCHSLDMVAAELGALGPGPDATASADASRLSGRMAAMVRYEWPDREDHEELLRQVLGHGRALHDLVSSAYFEYPVEDFRAR